MAALPCPQAPQFRGKNTSIICAATPTNLNREPESNAGTKQKAFTRMLMHWHHSHNLRSLPWKDERDPYRIWLSEMLLQQTRAAQAQPYYERFLEAFPTVFALAAAEDDTVFKLWEGLGYYSRCRHLIATAREVARQGHFPENYEGLLALKGVGPYTAAAIASFAFGLPHAVVDGNVYRVLARCFGLRIPTDSHEGKKAFQELANALLEKNAPGAFNQAMMDLGATVCLPQAPQCEACPLHSICTARQENNIGLLPVRVKRVAVKTRYFHYVFLLRKGRVWLHRREGRDIWRGLYEPLLIEAATSLSEEALKQEPALAMFSTGRAEWKDWGESRQRLTHQLICSRFFAIEIPEEREPVQEGCWVRLSELSAYAFPLSLKTILKKRGYF